MTFQTYPFPWAHGKEPTDDPRVIASADAARDLVAKRDAWLNPPGAFEAELKKRTLTNLYNARPEWLKLAHHKFDEAVFAANGWPTDLSDDEILSRCWHSTSSAPDKASRKIVTAQENGDGAAGALGKGLPG